MLGRTQAGGRIGIKSLLACAGDAVEVAHALHAFGQFGSGLCTFIDLLGVLERLLRRHGAHPGLAHARDLVHHVAGQTQLRLLDSPGGDTVAGRQGQQIQQAKGERTP